MSPRRRIHKAISLIGVLAGSAAFLTGCSSTQLQACSAVGWNNFVRVQLVGTPADLSQVSSLTLCEEPGCSHSDTGSSTDSPDPDPTAPDYRTHRVSATEWDFSVSMETPATVKVVAFAEDGTALGTQTVSLKWKQTGGNTVCSGPHDAQVVSLPVHGK